MNSKIFISVIVPVYKVEKYLHRCIDSVLAQTFTDFELILVDDGSPDNCGKICDEYAEKDERIHVIHKENGGLSSARNAGLDIATGDYIVFIDSDDYVENCLLQLVAEKLRSLKLFLEKLFKIYNIPHLLVNVLLLVNLSYKFWNLFIVSLLFLEILNTFSNKEFIIIFSLFFITLKFVESILIIKFSKLFGKI